MLNRLPPWLSLAALACGSGCSLLFNPDDLPGVTDAPTPDAMIDAPFDANRLEFTVTGSMPASVIEGAGAKGFPVLVIFTGTNIVDPTITVAWSDGVLPPPTFAQPSFAYDFNRAVVSLRVPVRTDLAPGAGCTTTLLFTFDQDGSPDQMFSLPLTCLNELTTPTDSPEPLYSRIELTAGQDFSGTTPIRLEATEDIFLDGAVLDVNASGIIGGPGGGNGGAVGNPGTGAGAGGAGAGGGIANGGGGGGGGYFGPGGSGAGGGAAGPMQGHEMLVPLGSPGNGVENAGAGGGGGGDGTAGTAGAGGGGGGVISLVAGGEIRVGSGTILITAAGAAGVGGTGILASGGSGGGGSGGAILIRGRAGVVFEDPLAARAWLDAPLGPAGAGTGMSNMGGVGALGRIRVDQPLATPTVAGMAGTGGLTAGPAWDPADSLVTGSGEITLQLRAKTGSYGIVLNGERWAGGTPPGSGNVTVSGAGGTVTINIGNGLVENRNTVCALFAAYDIADEFMDLDEAKSCVEVVYLPSGM